MALARRTQEVLTLAQAAVHAGTSETVLRHALASGALSCWVSAQNGELAFVCSPQDVDAWVAHERATASPFALTPAALDAAAVARTLSEIVDDLDTLHGTGLHLVYQVDQADADLATARDTLEQRAADLHDDEVPVEQAWAGLTRRADAQTKIRLLLQLTWRRLDRAAARLHALQDTLDHMTERSSDEEPS